MYLSLNETLSRVRVDETAGIGIADILKTENGSIHLAVVRSGRKLRAHYHRERDETYIILRGKGRLRLGEKFLEVSPGDIVTIPKRVIHGIEATGGEDLVFIFVSMPPFDPQGDRVFVE